MQAIKGTARESEKDCTLSNLLFHDTYLGPNKKGLKDNTTNPTVIGIHLRIKFSFLSKKKEIILTVKVLFCLHALCQFTQYTFFYSL